MLVLLGITFGVFYALGLYQRELLSLRALHLLTLAKALLWSAALGALVVFLLRLPVGFQSRFTVVTTFALFFLFAALVRVVLLTRLLAPNLRNDMRETLVVGWPYRTEPLRERLHMLKGFNKVTLVEAVGVEPVIERVQQQVAQRRADGTRSSARCSWTPAACPFSRRWSSSGSASAPASPPTWPPTGCGPSPPGACSSTCSKPRWCVCGARPGSTFMRRSSASSIPLSPCVCCCC